MEITMDNARAFLDYTQRDEGSQAREALYQSINDKIMNHIESKKQEIAQNLMQPHVRDPLSTAQDSAV
jgi:hypothetical protein